MELEPSRIDFRPVIDRRPLVPEPLPVRLLAIDDVRLPSPAGLGPDLQALYVKVLGFQRDETEEGLVLRAENVRVRFDFTKPPLQRDEYRPLGIAVPSLADLEMKLIESKIEYVRQRGLVSGQDQIVLRDPAGNWLELSEFVEVR